MDSKEYFENNKEKILATAKFLCSKDPSKTIEEQNELNNIMSNTKDFKINCNLELLDFGIVTEYDYWSIRQSCKDT